MGFFDGFKREAALTVIDSRDADYLTEELYASLSSRDAVNTYMHQVVQRAYADAFEEAEYREEFLDDVQQVVDLLGRREDFLRDLQRVDKAVSHIPGRIVSYADNHVEAMDVAQYEEYVTQIYLPAVAEFLRVTAEEVDEYGGGIQQEEAVRDVTVAAGQRLAGEEDREAARRAVSSFFTATFDVLNGLATVMPEIVEKDIPGLNGVLGRVNSCLPEEEVVEEAEECVKEYIAELFDAETAVTA